VPEGARKTAESEGISLDHLVTLAEAGAHLRAVDGKQAFDRVESAATWAKRARWCNAQA
jgi:hypothetical protein